MICSIVQVPLDLYTPLPHSVERVIIPDPLTVVMTLSTLDRVNVEDLSDHDLSTLRNVTRIDPFPDLIKD